MRTETLKVDGMTCGACVNAVTNALRAVEGVRDVDVTLEPGEAKIEFDERATSTEQLHAAVQQAGYKVDDSGGRRQAKAGCCS